jgi:hypothetical protein
MSSSVGVFRSWPFHELLINGFGKIESFYILFLLQMIKAPITPGTHAHSVRRNTIMIEPQPLSRTANGGKIMQRITRQSDIVLV